MIKRIDVPCHRIINMKNSENANNVPVECDNQNHVGVDNVPKDFFLSMEKKQYIFVQTI